MNAAVRPIDWALGESVFYGVVMNVIDMPGKIMFIPYSVFPKQPLPYRLFLFALAATVYIRPLVFGNTRGECAFNVAPTN